MGTSNQMLLPQVSKSPIINNNLLIIYDLPPTLLVFFERHGVEGEKWGWWKTTDGGDFREAESIGDYNRGLGEWAQGCGEEVGLLTKLLTVWGASKK